MKSYIKALSFYVPEYVLRNEELVLGKEGWTSEKISDKIGINQRHIAQSDTSLDLAEKAALKLFQEWDIKKETIDFVILCTQSPDYFLPTSACILQDRLGLNISCGAFDFNLGCSGFVYGLSIAKGLIASAQAQNVLLVTAETYSKFIEERDIVNRSIFGDAAAATLVSDTGYAEIMNPVYGTDGSGYDRLIVKTGGMKHRERLNDYHCTEDGGCLSSDHLYMDGPDIFSFTLDKVPKLVEDVIKKNDLSFEEIDLFVLHQANKYLMEFLRKKMRISVDKFYYCMSDYGNTVSSTIPIALYHALKENTISAGDIVLLAGFGVGLSWAGNILSF